MCVVVERYETLSDLLQSVAEIKDPFYFLAGGTDLMVMLKSGMIDCATFLDISDIPELKIISKDNGNIVIGSGVTHYEITHSPILQRYAPALVKACANIGGPQIRARGTIGGNIANASPAGDAVPALFTLGAELELLSPHGRRTVKIEDYTLAPRRTTRANDEMIATISFPARENLVGSWTALGQRKAMAISKISVAVSAVPKVPGSLDKGFEYLKVAFGAVGPTVLQAPETEAILLDGITPESVAKACKVAVTEVKPISDIRSTEEYRRNMSSVILRDCLEDLK